LYIVDLQKLCLWNHSKKQKLRGSLSFRSQKTVSNQIDRLEAA